MKIANSIKSITHVYNKMSNCGKILFFVAFLLIIIVFFKSLQNPQGRMGMEGFETSNKFLFKKNNEVYDDFYAEIYDYLVFNNLKNDYEIGNIENLTKPSSTSLILDVGCGTGHHVNQLSKQNLKVIGIDISPSMIKQAKKNFPEYNFRVGDVLDETQFKHQMFTHILCMYFTIYYFQDKRRFFDNCMEWLIPGGYLVVHLVNREKFDPILPPGNPLYIVSPQKYAKERITKTKVNFNEFKYESNFKFDKDTEVVIFDEKFKFDDGRVRKQEQTLYMEDTETILTIAQECGFILEGKVDLVKCAYEYQYLYIFTKPN
jgi:SAM-dependent methyltransferase